MRALIDRCTGHTYADGIVCHDNLVVIKQMTTVVYTKGVNSHVIR